MKETLEYYSARLFDTLMSNQGMQAIVELCAEFLGNPVAVGTDRLTVLYTSHNMPPQVPMSSPGIISPDFATEHSFIQFNEKAFYSRKPVLTSEQWGGYRTLLSRLMLHGEVVGYMSILFCNSSYTSDIDPLVELMIRTIESELLKSNILSFRNTTPAERLLASILAGGDSGLNSNADAVIQLGLNKQSSFYIATFRMSHYIVANKPNSIYKDALHQMTGAIISIFYKESIVQMIQGNARDLNTPSPKRQALEKYLSTYGLCGGISYMCRQIADIPEGFNQAQKAMNTAAQKENVVFISYDRIAVSEFMNHTIFKNHLDYKTPELLTLLNYDQAHHTDYCGIIEKYVENEKNVHLTALSLNLSKSSVYRIIERIKTLTDIDFNQNEQLFSIYLGIKIHRQNV